MISVDGFMILFSAFVKAPYFVVLSPREFRARSDQVGFGRILLASVGFCRIRSESVGFGIIIAKTKKRRAGTR